jgi:hypothetical protein
MLDCRLLCLSGFSCFDTSDLQHRAVPPQWDQGRCLIWQEQQGSFPYNLVPSSFSLIASGLNRIL